MATPTGKHSSETTHAVNDELARAEAVVTEVERLMAPEPERPRLWARVQALRDSFEMMIEQWERIGRDDLADEIRDQREKLDAETGDREPSLKKLRSIVDAERIAIEKAAYDAVLMWLDDKNHIDNDGARRLAEPLLGKLRGYPVELEEVRAKVLAAIRRKEGNTSRGPENIARRMVRGLYQVEFEYES
jgi:hypothetical protein